MGFKERFITRQTPIAPLVTFRIIFGILMAYGALRFLYSGWVDELYGEPTFFFSFYGFNGVEPLGTTGMTLIYFGIALTAICVALGFLYRPAIISFFLLFTYSELVDATNYLNHYYLVVLISFLMIFMPLGSKFSLDAKLFPKKRRNTVPVWMINILIFQLCVVYFYAGFAKLNSDWLFRAMPMAVWLPERQDFPLLGFFFKQEWTAFIFSWMGAIYDCTIWIFLLWKRTRLVAYLFVLVFHLMTWSLFNIGMFPLIMIGLTPIFFSARFHEHLLGIFGYEEDWNLKERAGKSWFTFPFLIAFTAIQVLLPLRYLYYGGNVLWHEQGYRFSWRVMLLEKSGTATFRVKDPETGDEAPIRNSNHLTAFQEKQMAIQPDFILQYAHHLHDYYEEVHGIVDPEIRADVFVALNRRPSRRFIDPNVDLSQINDSFAPKEWVLPFKEMKNGN